MAQGSLGSDLRQPCAPLLLEGQRRWLGRQWARLKEDKWRLNPLDTVSVGVLKVWIRWSVKTSTVYCYRRRRLLSPSAWSTTENK